MEYRDVFYNLELVRESIFTDDALRSFLFILAGSIVLFLFAKGKNQQNNFGRTMRHYYSCRHVSGKQALFEQRKLRIGKKIERPPSP